jgi:hypothetical protein
MKLTNIQRSEIIHKYVNCRASQNQLSREYNCKNTTINKILKSNNIKLRDRYKLTPDEEINIISDFNSGMLIKDISIKYNENLKLIYSIIHRHNLSLRSEDNRTYHINHNYFDNIDTTEKAFYFGLLFADGCNDLFRNRISISLIENNSLVLYKLRNILQGENGNKMYRVDPSHNAWSKQFQIRYQFSSKNICEKLNSHGMIPSVKSKYKKFPDVIGGASCEIIKSFILGYIIGNGSVELIISKTSDIIIGSTISIASTKEMCQSIKLIFETYINKNLNLHINKTKSSYTKVVSCNNKFGCYHIAKWLLNNSYNCIDIRKLNDLKLYKEYCDKNEHYT